MLHPFEAHSRCSTLLVFHFACCTLLMQLKHLQMVVTNLMGPNLGDAARRMPPEMGVGL